MKKSTRDLLERIDKLPTRPARPNKAEIWTSRVVRSLSEDEQVDLARAIVAGEKAGISDMTEQSWLDTLPAEQQAVVRKVLAPILAPNTLRSILVQAFNQEGEKN